MGKPKQQVLSRFFSPKPAPVLSSAAPDPPPPLPPNPKPSAAHPPVSTVASFSPAKRARALSLSPKSPAAKRPNPTPPPSRDAVRRRLLEPLHQEPPRLLDPTGGGKGYTPLEQQVVDLKARHPDVLLMVEVGYRFRFFGEDAAVAAAVLGIVAHPDRSFLTASVPNFRLGFHVRRLVAAGHKVGVVRQTETAAIKAAARGVGGAPFSRGLSAVYTRATIEAAAGELEGGGAAAPEEGSSYLVCIVDKEVEAAGREGLQVKVGLVAIEVSTGEVVHGEFLDSDSRSGLEALLLGLAPVEVILGTPLSFATEKIMMAYVGPTSNVRVERVSCEWFGKDAALAELITLFEKSVNNASRAEDDRKLIETNDDNNNFHGIEGIMAMPELVVQALALSVRYLKGFGMERIICFGSSFRPFSADAEFSLSANALQQLEVFRNNSDGTTEGSLFQIMNNTCTSFGSRLLRNWLTRPLCNRHLICARHDAVSEIFESMGPQHSVNNLQDGGDRSCTASVLSDLCIVLSSVLALLGRSPDIQRGISRIFHCKATAKEFVGVIQSILTSGKQLQKLVLEDIGIVSSPHKSVHSPLLRRLINTASSSTILNSAVKLLSCLNKDAADQGDMLNLFIASVDQFPEVAEGHVNVKMAEHKLDLLIVEYRKQFAMHNLEFKTVAGTTHLIELPVDRRVPSNWIKINSTKKAIRYHTPEILKNLDKLLLAKEELAVICRSMWHKFLTDFGKYYAQFQAVVESLAALDCLYSLAVLAKQNNYIRPIFVHDNEPSQIHIKDGRHPVLESLLGDNFVPNDTELHADGEYCQIVTGPNMGGKSCYIRQVALITMMAQVGSFVPASSAMLHVVDGIYTRMGASDSIQQGISTFHEEMNEASNILHNCSSRSLVIIDELGRGTSTHDGVAIAYSTLHYLLKEKKCIVIFVTHYPKILDIQREFEGSVGAYHVSYLATRKLLEVTDKQVETSPEANDLGEIIFLYKLVAGASDRSFGLNVALLAQLPSRCIKRASVMAAKLQEELSPREEIKLRRTTDAQTVDGPSESSAEVGNCTEDDMMQRSI
ncbi:DNA mismatch repair protein MSH3 isoform X2 [Zea mays]|uniref:DNA mismatch repair protein MSH3 isoform X2 n=1 Tax=Zea mays TaxID=4577 RepID=UPI0009AA55CD|nr:DNA mismatch repair protein MSH3 isoform X2 [Zea mays]XP_020401347.1 DNA mismatch repair protein MSH3 isoform X2 [Zea mays]|eukprot:XP_020401346.1 DNA mismatch repair protein MSH3 isoform X2 [Zea mays]